MGNDELPQSLRRGESESIAGEWMCSSHETPGGEDLWRHHVHKRAPYPQRQQARIYRIQEPVVRQRAGGPWDIKPLERHLQPSGQRPHVVVFGDGTRRDQHAIGADTERGGALLGRRKGTGWQAAAQAIEFRAAGARPALRQVDAARFGNKRPDRSAPTPLRRPFELDDTQTAAPPRLFVYKQAAGGGPNTTDDPTINSNAASVSL